MKEKLLCLLSFLLLFLVSCTGGGETAPAPYLPAECVGMDCKELEDAFRSSGFTNISLVPQDTSISSSSNKVISIEIDIPGAGTYKDYNSANKFSLDSEVIITYNRYIDPSLDETPGNPLMDHEFSVEDVMNGTGDTVLGQYAVIRILQAEFDSMTSENLQEFAEKRVEGSGYNWVSIIVTGGNGICFPGSDTSFAEYGKLDEDGSLLESVGTWIRQSDGSYSYSENG